MELEKAKGDIFLLENHINNLNKKLEAVLLENYKLKEKNKYLHIHESDSMKIIADQIKENSEQMELISKLKNELNECIIRK